MSSPVVVVDANVLYGIEVTDLLLTLATQRSLRVHWSFEILDEVKRNLAMRPELSVEAIEHRIRQMNLALPDARHDAPADLIAEMPINDKDRHVLALAVHLTASTVLTHNLRDFPDDACRRFGVEAIPPDQLLVRLDLADMSRAVEQMASRRRRPPRTPAGIIDRLADELPLTVASIRSHG